MLKKLFESTPSTQDDLVPEPPPQDVEPNPAVEEVTDLSASEDQESDLVPPLEEESTPDPSPEPEVIPVPTQEEDVESVRALILELHPTIVPELISGDSVSALIASIAPAQEAYNRIVATVPDVRIPAGGNPSISLDVESLSTFDMIRRGLANTRTSAADTVPAAKPQRKA